MNIWMLFPVWGCKKYSCCEHSHARLLADICLHSPWVNIRRGFAATGPVCVPLHVELTGGRTKWSHCLIPAAAATRPSARALPCLSFSLGCEVVSCHGFPFPFSQRLVMLSIFHLLLGHCLLWCGVRSAHFLLFTTSRWEITET